jgi:outer membrane lipoprotein SlyB
MQDMDNRSPAQHSPAHVPLSERPPHTRRNAALLGGGAIVLALGVIAGTMIGGRHDESALDYPPTSAGVTEPLATPDAQANRSTLEESTRQADRATTTQQRRTNTSSSRDRTSTSAGPGEYESRTVARAICNHCGVVESVTPVAVQGQNTGIGAVAGGVLGGVVGNQVGKGGGNTAATVLGAIGGGVAGHEIEKRQRTDTVYRVKVRMDDGSTKTFTRKSELAPGTKIEVHDGEMQVVNREG